MSLFRSVDGRCGSPVPGAGRWTVAIAIASLEQLPPEDQELIRNARDVASRSYNPYSGERVGAAVRSNDGQVFLGCFFENASYGLTICAEPAAILAANTAGQRNLTVMAVVGGAEGDGSPPVTPCGRCRQILQEVAAINGRDILLYCANRALTRILLTTSGELLPLPFVPP